MKKLVSLILAVAMVLCVLSFASAEETYRVAMITDSGDITDQSFNQTTYEACKAFCEENGLDFNYFKPTGDSDAERIAQVEAAIDEGYNVIVMPGYLFAAAIGECQPLYPEVKFIALDVSEYDLTSAGVDLSKAPDPRPYGLHRSPHPGGHGLRPQEAGAGPGQPVPPRRGPILSPPERRQTRPGLCPTAGVFYQGVGEIGKELPLRGSWQGAALTEEGCNERELVEFSQRSRPKRPSSVSLTRAGSPEGEALDCRKTPYGLFRQVFAVCRAHSLFAYGEQLAQRRAKSRLRRLRSAQRCGARLAA